MEQMSLNLARKWRSKTFKEIVGQELVVRILQNSLFKKSFFPVYLFSGQRGCGKTSTARVFASAMNCEMLPEFQKDPKSLILPCGICQSCIAMASMRHPDFVEIDAASYTGVDNIRNIIDTSSFLPVMSTRKVYLIDEVHMLSKAAFNAFLKILEEPPRFVTFILATTELQKVPDTVKSRCFQLLFNPIAQNQVVDHLETMCQKESLSYDKEALVLIANCTQGSLRDAVNLLEQTRFAGDRITRDLVSLVLGYVDDEKMYDFIAALLTKDQNRLLALFEGMRDKAVSVEFVVKRLLEIVYALLVNHYGVKQSDELRQDLYDIVKDIDIGIMLQLFDELCYLDQICLKTGKKQFLLEANFLRFVLGKHSEMNVEKKNQREYARGSY